MEDPFDAFQSNLLRTLREGDPYVDLQLQLGRPGSSAGTFHCHKHMLAAQSPVFSHLFQQMSLPNAGKATLRVECDPDAFNDIILYVYTGRTQVRPDHAVEILNVAQHYEIDALVRLYFNFLENYISVETVNSVLCSALQFGLGQVIQMCERFILVNATQTFAHPSIEHLPEDALCKLISNDDLQMQEIEVFLAVVRWGQSRFKNASQQTLQAKLSNAMHYVRFPKIDVHEDPCDGKDLIRTEQGKDMAEVVEPTGLVETSLLLEGYRFRATGGEQASHVLKQYQFPPESKVPFATLSTSQYFSSSCHSSRTSFLVTSRSCRDPNPVKILTCMKRIEVGDVIKAIDGWTVAWNVEAVKKHLMGPKDTRVELLISRNGVEYRVYVLRCASDGHRDMNAERAMQDFSMSSASSIKPFDLSRSVNEARESLRNLQKQTAEDSSLGQDDGPLEEV
ncbi:hypothetical protein GUITHDRAFT_138531 [Guillardia theta CCMP2712]|uniref:BTB domain-containing protein n=1 Tax=Guillardia theta (strain CCMP2712) TaxID=905079 RepID=L1JBX8_GUITC|nr:hypothetical protein GUITHDRAFT_138531 [Guillardia theta CCMP2712]EKX46053.1 hypothetical protein GUITHDRAFT_138531 [Guillardia theta CCMP2712]|eukprot:XP_005833033.1 hypothetical protein GUITHDRAFT_138531 [Guillardia theta CCMP2712]